MEGFDYVSDSYSMELLVVLVAERIWGRVQAYLKKRDERLEAIKLEDAAAQDEKDQNNKLNDIANTLSEIKGKQQFFENYLNKKL